MKTLHSLTLSIVLAGSSHAQNLSSDHRWTDIQGRTMVAEFAGLDERGVTLSRGGRLITVPPGNLSAASAKLAYELDATQKASGLNAKVLAFSRGQMGRRVGDGECTSLVNRALAKAGAAGVTRHFPNPGDYVWGTLAARVSAQPAGVKGLDSLYRARGGDIIQMRDVFLQGRTPSGGTYWMEAYHHTAVLESVDPARGLIVVLHQNWNGSGVRRDVFNLRHMTSGWMRIYRPVARR